MAIKIVTDSTADLSPELVQRFNIKVVPLSVVFGSQVFEDTPDFRGTKFHDKVKELKVHPKSTQATPADFIKVFKPILDAGDEAIYVALSSGLSGTINSAVNAVAELGAADRIHIVDSKNLSMGIGLLACRASEMVAEGLTADAIVKGLERLIPRVKVAFIVHNLDYLYKGGRLSVAQAVMGNLLNIHPMIGVADGKMSVIEKVRGKWEKALLELIAAQLGKPEKVDPHMISITHSAGTPEARFLNDKVAHIIPGANIVTTEAGAVISCHCGPGTIGILYIEKE